MCKTVKRVRVRTSFTSLQCNALSPLIIRFLRLIYVWETLFGRYISVFPSTYLSALDFFSNLQFEISSLMNCIFSLFQTWIFYQATAGRKIQFNLGKIPVHQTWYFKLDNCKNQVQIVKELRVVSVGVCKYILKSCIILTHI